MGGLGKVFKGPKYKKKDFLDVHLPRVASS